MNDSQRHSLSIGVLAHNEQGRIGRTLRSLFMQDVFKEYAVEVVIVANGCVDETAKIAKCLLAEFEPVWGAHGSARVEQVPVAGKANAWNLYVHQLSKPEASILVLMDADIELLGRGTISSLARTLECHGDAAVAVGTPIKDVELKKKRTLFDLVLISSAPIIDRDNVPLCGQLYCVRSSEARSIVLPIHIKVEDGFLRALLLTRGFTEHEDKKRIVWVESASHKFEAVSTIHELYRHERWIIAGTIVNMLLFERFAKEASPQVDAMTLMKRWMADDREWLPHYIESEAKIRGWNLLPRYSWTRRWMALKGLPWAVKLRRLPIAALAAATDAVIFVAAIRWVRRGQAYRYWR